MSNKFSNTGTTFTLTDAYKQESYIREIVQN